MENLLPCSQETVTGSYREPIGSSHKFTSNSINILFNIILPLATGWTTERLELKSRWG
jgi:hypothetical protein